MSNRDVKNGIDIRLFILCLKVGMIERKEYVRRDVVSRHILSLCSIFCLVFSLLPRVNAQFFDKIAAISGPDNVYAGDMATMRVEYEASEKRKIIVVFQKNFSPWTSYGRTEVVVLAGKQTLDVDIPVSSTTPFGSGSYKFLVYITEENGWWDERFDYKSLENIGYLPEPEPTITPQPAGNKKDRSPFYNNYTFPSDDVIQLNAIPTVNLIKNGDFSHGMLYWYYRKHGNSSGSVSVNDDLELFCDVYYDSGSDWHLQAQQSDLKLKNGQEYILIFSARAEKTNRNFHVTVKLDDDTDEFITVEPITTSMTSYTNTFTMRTPTASDCKLVFNFGGEGDNGVILDDIVLAKAKKGMVLGKACPSRIENNNYDIYFSAICSTYTKPVLGALSKKPSHLARCFKPNQRIN